jgi:L-threonylcarbamoyladenylate synthase
MAHGPSMLQEAVLRLREGRLVAFPTETVYGLGADALSEPAIARVFAIKGRPSTNPLIVHVADTAMARVVVSEWPRSAQALADAFWPGPLTLVLPRAPRVPSIVAGGGPNVAVRCPDHPLTIELLRAFGNPLVGPSANPSGGVSPTRAAHVRAAFSSDDVLVLDGGACTGGIESTVLLLTEHPVRILRPGLISAEAISQVLQMPVVDFVPGATKSAAGIALPSPGMLERHYAPRTPARLVARDAIGAALLEVVEGPRAAGTPPFAVVISHVGMPVPAPHQLELLPADARGYAAGLYAALRSADDRGAAKILIIRPDAQGQDKALWEAVLDRLTRATA